MSKSFDWYMHLKIIIYIKIKSLKISNEDIPTGEIRFGRVMFSSLQGAVKQEMSFHPFNNNRSRR